MSGNQRQTRRTAIAPQGFRWGRLIRAMLKQDPSCSRIAREVNELVGRTVIDHRQIRALAANEAKHRLSVSQLRALHAFFAQHTIAGYDPEMFDRRLLDAAGQVGLVHFWLGSADDETEHANVIRCWDMKAMGVCLHAISARHPLVQYTVEDFPREGPDSVSRAFTQCKRQREENASIVAIGSPLASPGTEHLLSQMFGVLPGKSDKTSRLPWGFVWPQKIRPHFSSGFSIDERAIPYSRITVNNSGRGILIRTGGRDTDGEASGLFMDRSDSESQIHHAMILVQGRSDKRIAMVVAGTTGPATFVAARTLAGGLALPCSLSVPDKNAVTWALMEVIIPKAPFGRGDSRSVPDSTHANLLGSGWWITGTA